MTGFAPVRNYAAASPSGFERLGQIVLDVLYILEAHRQPNETFSDAELGALHRTDAIMRRRRRMRDEAFRVAEIVGDLCLSFGCNASSKRRCSLACTLDRCLIGQCRCK